MEEQRAPESADDAPSIRSAAGLLDARLRDAGWIETLETGELLSETELRRAAFLATALAQPALWGTDVDAAALSAHGGALSGAVRMLASADVNDAEGLSKAAEAVRRACLPVEDVLAALRESSDAQLDSHLDIGKTVLQTREKIGLALGGGGLWGLSHIGALEELQASGIPIDLIGAASMGALVGGVASGLVDERHQLTPRGVDYMKAVATNIRTLGQLATETDGKRILPLDTLLNVPGYEDVYGQLMDKAPGIPFFAQVARHAPDGSLEYGKFLSSADAATGRDIVGNGGHAAASSALKMGFGLDPVSVKGDTYSDDTTIYRTSNSGAVAKAREQGATYVIGIPVSTFDTDSLLWIRWLQDWVNPSTADRGDLVVEPKRWHDLVTGWIPGLGRGVLSNFSKGMSRFAANDENLRAGNGIALPTGDFIAAGKQAMQERMTEILKRLGLVRMTESFEA